MRVATCHIEGSERDAQLSLVVELGAWWVQFGDSFLLYAANSKWNAVAERAEGADLDLEMHPGSVKKRDMHLVVQTGHRFQQKLPEATILLDQGRYLAVELSQEEVREITALKDAAFVVQPLEANSVVFDGLSLSGRYKYREGASEGEATPGEAALTNPIYKLEQPIHIPYPAGSELSQQLRFTLHIDIDGTDPLGVVSGTVAKGPYLLTNAPPHFISRVTADAQSAAGRNLVVEEFSFQWPESSNFIDRLEITLAASNSATPVAEVTFIATGPDIKYGPYSAARESEYFREIEFEIDFEDSAVSVEPYNTHLHPDRPADLPEEELTLEQVFARSGIHITRSAESNEINTSEAGENNRWSYLELHDAMACHWSAYEKKPQWKMWIFLAGLADSDTLGGVMFDGDIDEPGGVDRQGTAIFTKCPQFHSEAGDYVQANLPAAEAIRRELFFNLIHETGHAFNLAHSFQKSLGSPWSAPSWMPIKSDDLALSWMNYPDRASPGLNASWFYDRFRFRFDDTDNLFLRHAPARFVQMGNEAWFQNHGRVFRGTLDPRLELIIRGLKESIELGEPTALELRLRNISQEKIIVHPNLDPSDGFVEIAVTNPQGERRPFIPITHTRNHIQGRALAYDERIYQAVDLTVGRFGFPFKEPGPYRIEASYTNLDGTTAAAVMQLWVRPPANYDDRRVISELYNARVGSVLSVGGSRTMDDVEDKLKWVSDHLGQRHPAQIHIAEIRSKPLANPYKRLDADSNKVVMMDPDPGMVEHQLAPVLEDVEAAADTIGHIGYQKLVDTYTDSAVVVGKRTEAREAQVKMLGLFEKRKVIQPVLDAVGRRAEELR